MPEECCDGETGEKRGYLTKQCGEQIREPEMCGAFIIRERMTIAHRISFEGLKEKNYLGDLD